MLASDFAAAVVVLVTVFVALSSVVVSIDAVLQFVGVALLGVIVAAAAR